MQPVRSELLIEQLRQTRRESGADIPSLVSTYLAEGKFDQALELSAIAAPECLNEIFARAGNFFQEKGLLPTVWKHLSAVGSVYRKRPAVLFALLEAANAVGRVPQVRADIEDVLACEPASDLRALHALLCLPAQAIKVEASRAYAQLATPFTALALGRALDGEDPKQAETLFRESIDLAEARSDTFALLRATWALTVQLISRGAYSEARHYTDWALTLYRKRGIKNNRLLKLLTNTSAYARILIGEVDGLYDELERLTGGACEDDAISRLLRSTQGDLLLALGRPAEALEHYRAALKGASRSELAETGPHPGRCLEALGFAREALANAEGAYWVAKGTRSSPATALGLARLLRTTDPSRALKLALEATQSATTNAPVFAQASALAAYLQREAGDLEVSSSTLRASVWARRELAGTGLVLLECPQVTIEVGASAPTLKLTFLGGTQVLLADEELHLSARQRELLAVLALHPEGLTAEQLKLHLFGEQGPRSLKALLARTRKVVPIASRPYKIAVPVKADFVQAGKFLANGKVAACTALYAGPLLAESDSPRLEKEREALEAQFFNAALTSRSADILLVTEQVIPGRLEVLEALLAIMPDDDSRCSALMGRYTALKADLSC